MNFKIQNELSETVIGCAIEVNKQLGPGLIELLYERALCYEFQLRGIDFSRQHSIPVIYKGHGIGNMRVDLLIEDTLILEIKASSKMLEMHEAQLISYMKLTGLNLGLIINFHFPLLKHGIKRMVL